ncbi:MULTISPECIES: amino acid ABC transporter permease [Clostridium]|uniref:Arginine transport system permease protein ArtQ n=2 Tax=Clostridium TaxID=1485 RepID=A0A151AL31_9CLOT|nr:MULTISPECIES: amino acid ABC transporter permease [Clostridium]KYH28333.1 arginine transport system permease protein ArtQ [Clostridium colicanis DSM 13634]MBE6043611.1 amino acid ABC transporter permease [Clostridium thermopalmarium]PRR68775.1 Arginine transport system permease protein ArtQ [Clostridium thermopalmarium DSM 5974]PVZ22642.1 polar amino acid transport system permease protein [Clostridium thermopalmarium DSM 5974]
MDNIISLLPQVFEGLKVTLQVFILTLVFSIPLGIVVSIGRLSKNKILNKVTGVYILIMRGTPLLLQIVFIFFGLPNINISFDRFPAAIIAFTLNYAAYFAEIFRAGISSIDEGQYEGAKVLGFSQKYTFFRIILPQAFKRILPAMANEVITLVKDTALVYVLGLDELLKIGKIASNTQASLIPLVVVGVVYLLLIGVFTQLFKLIENRYSYYQ